VRPEYERLLADIAPGTIGTLIFWHANRFLRNTDEVNAFIRLDRLDRAMMQVRRIGVNLNQAVAALNATGQQGGDLLPYAAQSMRRASRLEAIVKEARTRMWSMIGPRTTADRDRAGTRSPIRLAGQPWSASGRTASPVRPGPGPGVQVR
jgi:hypothetical protein